MITRLGDVELEAAGTTDEYKSEAPPPPLPVNMLYCSRRRAALPVLGVLERVDS